MRKKRATKRHKKHKSKGQIVLLNSKDFFCAFLWLTKFRASAVPMLGCA